MWYEGGLSDQFFHLAAIVLVIYITFNDILLLLNFQFEFFIDINLVLSAWIKWKSTTP